MFRNNSYINWSYIFFLIGNPKNKVCPECDTAFKVPIGLKHHLLLHTGELPFLCLHCWRSFSSHIGKIFGVSNLVLFSYGFLKIFSLFFTVYANLAFPWIITLNLNNFPVKICPKIRNSSIRTRTNVKFVPRWSWVRIILIIEWEYRERLKERGYKGYYARTCK